MSINFENVIGSAPFSFIVGPNRKSFAVHKELVAHYSAPLKVMMKGSMREAQDGFAELKDVDEQTFVRFCEYAYIGDYTTAQDEVILGSSVVAGPNTPLQDRVCVATSDLEFPSSGRMPADESFESFANKKRDKKKKSIMYDCELEVSYGNCDYTSSSAITSPGKQKLLNSFQGRHYSAPISAFQRCRIPGECEDYTDIFLCHARVYVFAEIYNIAGLRTLALYKLHQTLKNLKDYDKRISDIVSLARFSYSNDNTGDNEVGQKIDSLRELVVHFVACVFELVAKDDSFLVLMEEGGPFVRDLMGMLLKRVN